MHDPKRASAPALEAQAGPAAALPAEDWWKGWRLDEPADSLVPGLEGGTEDWWAGWHAALLRDRLTDG